MTDAVTVALAVLLALGFTAAWPLLAHLDNELEATMPTLRDHIRRYLGTDTLPRMEHLMADWLTVLNGLVEQTTAASAAQATSFSNLQGAINRQTTAIGELRDQLQAAIDGQNEVTPEMQAKVTEIATALDDMKKAADTADNGFEPVVEEPTDPEQPVDEVPPGEPTVEVPTDPGTPDENPPAEDARRR